MVMSSFETKPSFFLVKHLALSHSSVSFYLPLPLVTHGRQHVPELLSPRCHQSILNPVGFIFRGLSAESCGGPGIYDRLVQSKNDSDTDTLTLNRKEMELYILPSLPWCKEIEDYVNEARSLEE